MFFCYYNKGKKINITGIYEHFPEHDLPFLSFQSPELTVITFGGEKNYFENDKVIICGRLFLYNKKDLDVIDQGDYETIAHLYIEHHISFVKLLNGDFSFIIWDKKMKKLHIFRDHIGSFPLYYSNSSEYLMISSFLSYLLMIHPKPKINFSWVKAMIWNNVSEQNETIYEGIYRFVPASCYSIDKSQFSFEKYWELSIDNHYGTENVNYLKVFSDKFKKAVISRMLSFNNGFEMSGGLDSSAIICHALQYSHNSVAGFSHVLPNKAIDRIRPFQDERKYHDLIKEMYPQLEHHNVPVTGSIIEDIRNYIYFSKDLPQQQFQILSDSLYKEAEKRNIDTIFSGFGGDEAVSSSGFYYYLELIFNNRFIELMRLVKERKRIRIGFIIHILKKIVDIKLYQAGFNHRVTGVYKKEYFIRKKVRKDLDQSKLRNEEPPSENYYQYKLAEAITRRHITSRIENCNIAAYRYGIVYRHPMLDRELLEYYFSLTYKEHNTPEWPRKLIRDISGNIVPDEIILRRDKTGATIPNVYYRIINDEQQIREYIKNYDRNSYIASLIDLGAFQQYFEKVVQKSTDRKRNIYSRTLINYLTLLVFFDLYESSELFNHNINFSRTK